MNNFFNPDDWMPSEEQHPNSNNLQSDTYTQVELAIEALEQRRLDITAGYARWRDLGFALSELGESGREYFHRISRMNPGYDAKECELQYTHCLRSKGSGISLGSFFHYVREAGIPLGKSSAPSSKEQLQEQDLPYQELEEENKPNSTPTFPEEIYENLPSFPRNVIAKADSPQERDILLLGLLTVTSACLGNFFGYYLKHLVFPNLYFFLTGRASAGKGNLKYCRAVVYPIHWQMREQSKVRKKLYDQELSLYNESKQKGEKPEEPKEKMLFLPANSSSTGFLQLLSDNDGRGLIYETEGDTLTFIFKADYGNYSDGFRKAFHHEPISYFRRTDKEHVEIEKPCVSTLLSGTPKQILSLVKDAENGLFSRFLYYHLDMPPIWKDTFTDDGEDLEDYYKNLGSKFFNFWEDLQELGRIQVMLTDDQKADFFENFNETLVKYLVLLGEDYEATVKRMGLVAFRIMMLLTAFRLMEWKEGRQQKVQVADSDYRTAMIIVRILLKHGAHIFSKLPLEKEIVTRPLPKKVLLEMLGAEFRSNEFNAAASKLKISQRTVERYVAEYIRSGLVQRLSRGEYRKRVP